MTAEELYEKEFGDADNISKESVLRLLRHFAKALELEREQALRIHDVVGRSEQLKCDQVCDWYRVGHQSNGHQECRTCGRQKAF